MSQKSYKNSVATLYIVPTPIGNLSDITARAVNVLDEADVVFCEDTRVTRQLLMHLNIDKKLVSAHDHNEDSVKDEAIKFLSENKTVALVSDRGTPIISDPGYRIVEYVIEKGYNVVSLPGPTAFVPALTSSGINPYPFMFYGFLSHKASNLKKELQALSSFPYTMIFYETPRNIKKTLKILWEIMGDRKISISREITKVYEEVYRGNVSDVIEELREEEKGEFVLIVSGNTEKNDFASLTIKEHVELYADEMSSMDAIKLVAKERNIPKSVVYNEIHQKED